MKKEKDEEKIIKILQHMPGTFDKTPKEELLKRISKKLAYKEKNLAPKKKIVPFFSFSVVILIMLVMVPIMINQKQSFSSENKMSNEITDKSTADNDYGKLNEENKTENIAKARIMSAPSESYVARYIEQKHSVIYVGLSDPELKYVIPISLIGENTTDLSTYYDQLSTYLDEFEWGLSNYLFTDIPFDVDVELKEVTMVLPDDFNLVDGSASANIFEKILTTMFSPYDIEKVLFRTISGEEVDLGHFGVIKEMLIKDVNRVSYKLYQISESQRPFLIPIPHQENIEIMDSFEEMRISEQDFHIYQTIPDDILFTLEQTENRLLVRFTDKLTLEDEQEYVIMIDAMLMTAKGYGFDSIEFKNTADYIGPYDLSKPVQVPEAVNPIYID